MKRPRPTQVEQTAKKFKAMVLLGGVTLVVGVLLQAAQHPAALGVLIPGLLLTLTGKALAWWFHG